MGIETAMWGAFSQSDQTVSIELSRYVDANDNRAIFEPPLVITFAGETQDFRTATFSQAGTKVSFGPDELHALGEGDIPQGVDRVIGNWATPQVVHAATPEPIA